MFATLLTAILHLFRARIDEEERNPSEAAVLQPAAEMVADTAATRR